MGGAERLRLQILGGIGATEACGEERNGQNKSAEKVSRSKQSNVIIAGYADEMR